MDPVPGDFRGWIGERKCRGPSLRPSRPSVGMRNPSPAQWNANAPIPRRISVDAPPLRENFHPPKVTVGRFDPSVGLILQLKRPGGGVRFRPGFLPDRIGQGSLILAGLPEKPSASAACSGGFSMACASRRMARSCFPERISCRYDCARIAIVSARPANTLPSKTGLCKSSVIPYPGNTKRRGDSRCPRSIHNGVRVGPGIDVIPI